MTTNYKALVRKEMTKSAISAVNKKLPNWTDHLFGFGSGFHTHLNGLVWNVSVDGNCYCEETGMAK